MLIGLIIADLAWHFSNAYAANGKFAQEEAFERIVKGWDDGHRIRAQSQTGDVQ